MDVYTTALEAQVNLTRASLGVALALANIAFEEDKDMGALINHIDVRYDDYQFALAEYRKAIKFEATDQDVIDQQRRVAKWQEVWGGAPHGHLNAEDEKNLDLLIECERQAVERDYGR